MFVNNVRWFVGLVMVLCLVSAGAQAQGNSNIASFRKLADFEVCQRRYADGDCLLTLEKYVRATPKDAMNASVMVRRGFFAYVSLRFFEMVPQQDKKFCQDEDLQLAVVSGLALPKDYQDAERARRLFSGKCYAEHIAAVIKEIDGERAAHSYLKENACPILQKHNQAPPSCQPAPVVEPVVEVEERLPTIDTSQIKLGVIKVYRGPEGERVTVAAIQGEELYLVRFDGISGPWEGKVLLHKRADLGNDAADFWTENKGKRWNSIVRRNGMEIFVPGYKSRSRFSVGFDEKLSQEADAKALLNAYTP